MFVNIIVQESDGEGHQGSADIETSGADQGFEDGKSQIGSKDLSSPDETTDDHIDTSRTRKYELLLTNARVTIHNLKIRSKNDGRY